MVALIVSIEDRRTWDIAGAVGLKSIPRQSSSAASMTTSKRLDSNFESDM